MSKLPQRAKKGFLHQVSGKEIETSIFSPKIPEIFIEQKSTVSKRELPAINKSHIRSHTSPLPPYRRRLLPTLNSGEHSSFLPSIGISQIKSFKRDKLDHQDERPASHQYKPTKDSPLDTSLYWNVQRKRGQKQSSNTHMKQSKNLSFRENSFNAIKIVESHTSASPIARNQGRSSSPQLVVRDPQGHIISPDKLNPRRCHPTDMISSIHGYLSEKDIPELMQKTGYTRRELHALFVKFKALCALSKTPYGIDKETFRNCVPMLSVEDDLFVNRVFEVLDSDGSGEIEWSEFVEAMSALERGSRRMRTEFLFKVYDTDRDGEISRDEMFRFFLSSLMTSIDPNLQEVSREFVDKVFSEVDNDNNGLITVHEALNYIESNPQVQDVYAMFGRSMTTSTSDAAPAGVNITV